MIREGLAIFQLPGEEQPRYTYEHCAANMLGDAVSTPYDWKANEILVVVTISTSKQKTTSK